MAAPLGGDEEAGSMSETRPEPREILNIDEAAALLGVSVKTFNKVLHSRGPARRARSAASGSSRARR